MTSHARGIVRPVGFHHEPQEDTMSVLEHLKEGFVTAAQLAALLFVPPALGGEPATQDASASRIEFVIRDDLAQLTLARRVSNTGDMTLDLARQLPTAGENARSLRVVRGERVVDLIRDDDCGNAAATTGETAHVQMATDEAIADALQLPPGESAWIEIAITHSLQGHGAVQRIELPWITAASAQGFVADRDAKSAVLLVTPHPDTRGRLVLHLRPDQARSQQIDLGVVERAGAAFLIALDRAALQPLAAGAIELAAHREDAAVWSTLPLRLLDPAPALAVDVAR
jgi:hypothetical protein